MKPKKRQKLCSNCDGEIDLDVIVCPYCAADLREEKPGQMPYTRNVRPLSGEQAMSDSLYHTPSENRELPIHSASLSEPVSIQETAVDEPKPDRTVGTILLLTVGVQMLLIGLLLALLSHNGTLTLKWDARLWFLYVFASIPFLIFGYRSLSKT